MGPLAARMGNDPFLGEPRLVGGVVRPSGASLGVDFRDDPPPLHQRPRRAESTAPCRAAHGGRILGPGGVFAWSAHAGVREREKPRHPLREAQPESADISVDFLRDVRPIFDTSCIGCHGPKKQRADFRVDRKQDFFAPGDAAPLIVPGNADESRLIAIVSGKVKNMKSAEDHLLPSGEIALLKAWINAGAEWPEGAQAKQSNGSEIKP